MKIKLVSHLDRQCGNKALIVNELSNQLNEHFEAKQYGGSLETIYFSVIALSKMFRELYDLAKPKFTKSKKMFECDVEFDFERFKNANDSELKGIILEGIIESLQVISEKVKDFDINAFEQDLKQLV